MRSTTSTLADAITARQRTLAGARLLVDWDVDGFGAGSLDDLSGHVVAVTVDGALQSDLPDEVRLVQGTVARTLAVTLGGGSPTDAATPTEAYFSPVAAASASIPLGGKERRNRPVTCDVGFVTASGVEYVRTFTGLTTGMPVAGKRVTLNATDNRSLLRQQLSLPAVPAIHTDPTTGNTVAPGLEATWLVSYVLARNGIYVSPPPRPGVRVWAPMHGSGQPVIHDELGGLIQAGFVSAYASGQGNAPCRFVPGPFVTALSGGAAGSSERSWLQGKPAAGTALFDQYGRAKGRVEAWIMIPPGALTGPFNPVFLSPARSFQEAELTFKNGSPQVDVGLDGVVIASLTGAAVTALYDGAWHPVGMWWDRTTGAYTVWLDGTAVTGSVAPLGTGGTSPGEDWEWYLDVDGGAAVAELHITAGTEAGDPWIDQIAWAAGAVLDRSDNQLDGIVPDVVATDSWELLKSVAVAERAAAYFDADGLFRYRTPAALVTSQAQNIQLTLTSLANITALTLEVDESRVRNIVTAPWTRVVTHASNPDHVYDATDVLAIPPGASIFLDVTLKGPSLQRTIGITLAVNTKIDGTGTADGPVTVPGVTSTWCGPVGVGMILTTANTASIQIKNASTAWRYLVDTTGAAAFGLLGVYCTVDTSVAPVVVSDQDSIDTFGPSSLSLSGSPWRQSAGWATGIAAQTLADVKDPLPQITSLACVGDPRLEYYDRVHIQDPTGTQLDGAYWVKAVALGQQGSSFTMTVAATAARDIALFDTAPGFDVGVWS